MGQQSPVDHSAVAPAPPHPQLPQPIPLLPSYEISSGKADGCQGCQGCSHLGPRGPKCHLPHPITVSGPLLALKLLKLRPQFVAQVLGGFWTASRGSHAIQDSQTVMDWTGLGEQDHTTT